MRNFGLTLIGIFLCLLGFYFLVLRPEKYTESDLYDEIVQRDFIRVGINTDSRPFGFIDKNGNLQG